MKILSLLFLIIFTNGAAASIVDEFINEGINLHDQGQYEGAINKYQEALKLEPNNSLALYELTLSYMLSNMNNACIDTAKQGIKIKSNLEVKFMVALGSCYSQIGKIDEAITSFEEGLKINPTDSQLHLNIAVTFSNIQKDKKAIIHLKEAIKYSRKHASPYYFIAEMYRTTNYRIPALAFYMQFVLLEPNTNRSHDASKKIFYLMNQGLNKNEGDGMDIVVNPDSPKDEGDYLKYELALSVSAAASKPEDISYVDALTTFIKICSEIEDKSISSTFTWEYAMKNMITLQDEDVFNTYAYILASRAGIPGASAWLTEHKDEVKKMSSVIHSMDKKTL